MKENTELDVVNNDGSELEEGKLIIKLSKPITYEKKEYTEINMSCLYDVTADDMIKVDRLLKRSGNVDAVPEISLEYALRITAEASGIPYEFFLLLDPKTALRIKNNVMGFFYAGE